MKEIFNRFKNVLCFALCVFCAIGTTPVLAAASHEQEKKDNVDYEQLKIKSYKHWDLYLHENQCYLGRTFVQLKKEDGVDDFLSIEGEVRDEFFLIGEEVKASLKTIFQPDKMNYAALSNTSPVIHVHIIPRYKEPREFGGVTFKDTRWGSNYAPYDKSYVTDESVLFQIRDAIRDAL
jgi:diadenosine tetraphosphate (Ap4A) HIT family hydrolase